MLFQSLFTRGLALAKAALATTTISVAALYSLASWATSGHRLPAGTQVAQTQVQDGAISYRGPPRSTTPYKDCALCPVMVTLPGGSITVGSDNVGPRAQPRHLVEIQPFAISQFEVTWAEWMSCVEEGACSSPDNHGWLGARLPVINVTWTDAAGYAAWLSQRTGKSYRLPSEAEWEYAARAGTTTEFWWGDEALEAMANYRPYDTTGPRRPVEVGQFPPNPFGLYDVHGNVWEWTLDCWNPSHVGAFMDGAARTTGDCSRRVIRSGSWYYFPAMARSAERRGEGINVHSYNIGLRVLQEIQK